MQASTLFEGAPTTLTLEPGERLTAATLTRGQRDGRPRGTVSYTFLKRGIQEDDQYQLRTHLNDDAEIETHRFQPSSN